MVVLRYVAEAIHNEMPHTITTIINHHHHSTAITVINRNYGAMAYVESVWAPAWLAGCLHVSICLPFCLSRRRHTSTFSINLLHELSVNFIFPQCAQSHARSPTMVKRLSTANIYGSYTTNRSFTCCSEFLISLARNSSERHTHGR